MADSPNNETDELMGDGDFSKPDGRVEGSATKAYNDRLQRFIKEQRERGDADREGLSEARH